MSRSSDSASWRHVRGTALALLTVVLMWTSSTTQVRAEPPTDTAPVLDITAPIVDIHVGTATLDGAVAMEEDRDRGTKARLDSSVLFPKDSARLRPQARTTIRRLAMELSKDGPGKITVTGYTDDLGSAAHGLRLSKRRAAAVADLLDRSFGDDWPKITIVGKGEADPAVPNTSEKNRKLNRRVVVTVRR